MKWRGKVAVAAGAAALMGAAAWIGHANGYTLEKLEADVTQAPLAIFVAALLILPPLGVPLTIILFAIGARMGIFHGSLVGCGAIVVHHFIAAGASVLVKKTGLSEGEGAEIWRHLERKFGDHSNKLLFLFGLIPGPPYVIKLYLPLAMGARRWVFIWYSSTAHLIGAVVFVSLGGAFLKQNPWLLALLMLAVVALLAGLAALKRRELRPS